MACHMAEPNRKLAHRKYAKSERNLEGRIRVVKEEKYVYSERGRRRDL